MCNTYLSKIIHDSLPWETSQGPPTLKFQIKSYSHTTNGIIAIEVVDTQLPKSTKLELFKHNQNNCHSRQKQKKVNLKDAPIPRI